MPPHVTTILTALVVGALALGGLTACGGTYLTEDEAEELRYELDSATDRLGVLEDQAARDAARQAKMREAIERQTVELERIRMDFEAIHAAVKVAIERLREALR